MFGGMIMAFENSAVHDMILEYLERLPQDHTPVKAGILERSVMRAIAPKKLFPNPDDEFTDPKIGPNDSIIMNYSQIARWNRARDLDVYEESIIVCKIRGGGYMIMNGHHRWAGALLASVPRVRISITNNI